MATPPTPNDVYEAQQRLTRQLILAIAPLLAPFLGVRKTSLLGRAIAAAIFPTLRNGRKASSRLARQVYVAQKAAWNRDRAPIAEPEIRDYELELFVKAVVRDLEISGSSTVVSEDLERIANSADLHVRNAYRNTSLAYVHNDNDIRGWARIDPVPPTCEFCRLLISRGPVYKSEQSAGGRHKYHKGCTCVPQIVFRGQENDWPGREMFLAERSRYRSATKGKSGKAARKAWREAAEAANRSASVQNREKREQAAKSVSDETRATG